MKIGHFPSMEGNLNHFLTRRILSANRIFKIKCLLALFLHDTCAASQLTTLPQFFQEVTLVLHCYTCNSLLIFTFQFI